MRIGQIGLMLSLLSALVTSSIWAEGFFTAPVGSTMSFAQAKRFLRTDVYAPGQREYYCGCEITQVGNGWGVDWASCGYVPRKNALRASRIEWEHIVPAYDFGRQLQCWQQGGRKQCEATDPQFVRMEGDPHNLIPVVGEVNGDRGNLKYGMVGVDDGYGYGQCGSRVDFAAKRFMPRAETRGLIARVMFYFRDRYGLALSAQSDQLYSAWNMAYPVDQRECRNNLLIGARTGVYNAYVSQACQASESALSAQVAPIAESAH